MSDQSPEVDAISLASGVELNIVPKDEGLMINVTGDDDTPIYKSEHDRKFYKSAQKRRTIANKISQRVGDTLDSEAVAESFLDVCFELVGAHEDVADALRPPTVSKLIEETTAVEFYRAGLNSSISVSFAVDGREDTIEFTMSEFTSNSGIGTLQEQYATFFFPAAIDITPEHWEELKEYWREIADEVDGDDTDRIDAITDKVMEKLRERIGVPFEDKEALDRGKYNAVHETDPTARLDVTDVLWVTAGAFSDMVADVASHADYPDIVKELRERDVLVGQRKKVDGVRAYPFDPDAFDYDPDALATVEEDDPDDLVGGEL